MKALTLVLSACLVLAAHAAPPVVSNVCASQVPGTQYVDIYYDLSDRDGGTMAIPAGHFQMGDTLEGANSPTANVLISQFAIVRAQARTVRARGEVVIPEPKPKESAP